MSLSIIAIQRQVADFWDISLRDLLGPGKSAMVSEARLVGYYLARELTPYTVAQIGRAFHREHTSVRHGIIAIERRMQIDHGLATAVAAVKAELRTTWIAC